MSLATHPLSSITDHLEAPHFQLRVLPHQEQPFLDFCKDPLVEFHRFDDPNWPGFSTFRFDLDIAKFRQLLDLYLEAGYMIGFSNFDPSGQDESKIEFDGNFELSDFE